MSEERAERIVAEYFAQLAKALLPMPRVRRSQLLDELRAHVDASRAGFPEDSEAGVREALERLGDPEEIAAEALAGPHARRKGWTIFLPRRTVIGVAAAAIVALAVTLPLTLSPSAQRPPQLAALTAAVGGFPTGIAVDPASSTAYIAAGESNQLSMLDTARCNAVTTETCAQPRRAPTGGVDPIGVVVDQRTQSVYVVNSSSDTLAVLNARTCNVHQQAGCTTHPTLLPLSGGPEFLALDQRTETLYVADTNSGTVSVVDAKTCNAAVRSGCRRPVATVTVGTDPFPVAVDQRTNTVYVGTDQGLTIINGSRCDRASTLGCGTRPTTVSLPIQPAGITVDDSHSTLYVTGETGSVAILGTSTCNGTKSSGCTDRHKLVSVGNDARGAALDPATSTLYVANAGSDTVSLLDTDRCNAADSSGCTPRTVPVGSSPRRIAISTQADTAYVVNVLGNNLSLIGTQSCNAQVLSGCPRAHPVGVSLVGTGGAYGSVTTAGGSSSSVAATGGGEAGAASADSDCSPTTEAATSGGSPASVEQSSTKVAEGTVDAMAWSLWAAKGQSGATALEDGALVLDGRAYGLCPGFPNPAELELIDAGTNGVVAGVVGYPGQATVSLSTSTAGTFASGAALPSPNVQVVDGVSFFVGSLPDSACSYSSLELNTTSPGVSAEHNLGFGSCAPGRIVPITESQGVWQLPPGQFQAASAGPGGSPGAASPAVASLPAAGAQPADPQAAQGAVEQAFTTVYSQQPDAQKLQFLQGGAAPAVVAAGNAAAQAFPQISAGSQLKVLQVVFTDPTDAAVLYENDYQGSPVVGPKVGYAILDGGTWKVTRATYCADIDNAGTGVTC